MSDKKKPKKTKKLSFASGKIVFAISNPSTIDFILMNI